MSDEREQVEVEEPERLEDEDDFEGHQLEVSRNENTDGQIEVSRNENTDGQIEVSRNENTDG